MKQKNKLWLVNPKYIKCIWTLIYILLHIHINPLLYNFYCCISAVLHVILLRNLKKKECYEIISLVSKNFPFFMTIMVCLFLAIVIYTKRNLHSGEWLLQSLIWQTFPTCFRENSIQTVPIQE